MGKILIIPDVHNRVDQVDKIIKDNPCDKIIFLGDYFDSWGDSPKINRRTALWLKDSLLRPNRVHLMGNHDLSYAFSANRYCRCSGYTDEKSNAINEVVGAEISNLAFFHYEQGFLFTHAGLNSEVYLDYRKLGESPLELLQRSCEDARKDAFDGKNHWIINAGAARGGTPNTWGGILWNDWNREHEPIMGCRQVMGHTEISAPAKDGGDFNIDANMKYFAIIEDGEISFLDSQQNLE